MKPLLLGAALIFSFTTSVFADVRYRIHDTEYTVTTDGIEVMGLSADWARRNVIEKDEGFFVFGNDYLNVGAVTMKVKSKAREKDGCIVVDRHEYLRTVVIPTWSNEVYKFCKNRILVGQRYLNPKKPADAAEIKRVLFNVTKPRN